MPQPRSLDSFRARAVGVRLSRRRGVALCLLALTALACAGEIDPASGTEAPIVCPALAGEPGIDPPANATAALDATARV